MAAVSHLKNKKEAKLREGIEKIMTKCMLAGSPGVSAKEYIELLEASGVDLDEKEIAKIDKMTSELGIIDKNVFLAYAKKSSVFKNLLEEEKHNFDKAELAFKAIDKDASGYITVGELKKLGNMDMVKTEALMGKLDRK